MYEPRLWCVITNTRMVTNLLTAAQCFCFVCDALASECKHWGRGTYAGDINQLASATASLPYVTRSCTRRELMNRPDMYMQAARAATATRTTLHTSGGCAPAGTAAAPPQWRWWTRPRRRCAHLAAAIPTWCLCAAGTGWVVHLACMRVFILRRRRPRCGTSPMYAMPCGARRCRRGSQRVTS